MQKTEEVQIHLATFAQFLVLRVIIMALFKKTKEDLDGNDGNLAASKSERTISSFEENEELQACLSSIFPDIDCLDPRQNPPKLDPTWGGLQNPPWREVIAHFSQAPTGYCFTFRNNDLCISTEDIVKEALHLEPCQITPEIWTRESEIFAPTRWQRVTEAQKNTLLALGSRPFLCPAYSQFGPKIIGPPH
ncbi:uncharacterized protein BDW43DRAFT_300640 [Aspergillus alliaceus]|uniref:uncharacterized protein n=1 Tax=Petromyces alliaceus TaxID=209559 RepID=UPI0012A73253|nr:uncharacterized protein BDW43DRAFT_300640 [Aspergillus alliaceus]KAB8232874.1 hypothetical protein BDW43DRAFT_300640 [Aspergillus alliaceus]